MKKKFRNITVNGKEYAWATRSLNDCEGNILMLKIWFNKKVIFDKPMPKFVKSITPADVKYHIEKIQTKEHRDEKNK